MSARARAWAYGIGFTLVAGLVLWVTLQPATVDSGYEAEIERFLAALHRAGVPGWFGYRQLEFTANIAMFMPLGFFGGVLLYRRWAWGILLLPLASACIEGLQFLFLPGRYATVSDVLANSLGGWLGLLLAIPLVLRGSRSRVTFSRDRHTLHG